MIATSRMRNAPEVERLAMEFFPFVEYWKVGAPVCQPADFDAFLEALGKEAKYQDDLLYFLAGATGEEAERARRQRAILEERLLYEGGVNDEELEQKVAISHEERLRQPVGTLKQAAADALRMFLPTDLWGPETGQAPPVTRLAEVETAPVDWLVQGLLPRGEVSVLGADGGTGKGIWQAQLIAHVTTGRPNPFFPRPLDEPGTVLLFSGEDDARKVLRPRLLAAGADVGRVIVVETSAYYRTVKQQLNIGCEDFAMYFRTYQPALAILDPLQSFLDGRTEMAKRNQMRSAVTPFLSLCREVNAAGLNVMHTNKKGDVAGRQRLADSSDLWDMARSVLMMGVSKTDGMIYLSHEKSSYAKPARTTLFRIEDTTVEEVPTARAVFEGTTDRKDADFVAERRQRTAETRQTIKDEILNVLEESRLTNMESTRLKREVMKTVGCSERTYERAYKDLVSEGGIQKKAIRQKDGKNKWFTYLYCGDLSGEVAI